MNGKPRICFVSPEAYATLRPGVAEMAGGAGFQLVEIARELRARGHDVCFVVGDYGQPFRDTVDGFVTYRASSIATGRSRTRGPLNLVRLFRAMRAAKADHYVLRSIRELSFFILIFARLLGARYTFMVANLPHVTKEEMEGMSPRLRSLYARSLRRADRVTVQSREQQDMLRASFGVEAPIVPNGIEIPAFVTTPAGVTHDVSWVATIKPAKRPDRLVEIARALPDRTFLVAGGPGSDLDYHVRLTEALADLPNVTVLGFVPPDQVHRVYERARVFLNTSQYEGFPNTFLFAWSRGIPTCSLDIDPDGVVTREGLGIVDPDCDNLARRLDALLADDAACEAMRRRCHDYVRRHHARDHLAAAFLAALPERP